MRRGPQPEGARVAVAVCWYREDQWARLREIAADRDRLEETHAEWLEALTRSLPGLRASVGNVELVEVDVEELLRWCRERFRPVNGSARSEYAVHLLQQRVATERFPPRGR